MARRKEQRTCINLKISVALAEIDYPDWVLDQNLGVAGSELRASHHLAPPEKGLQRGLNRIQSARRAAA